MNDFLTRLIQEKEELDLKTNKLEAFLSSEKTGDLDQTQLALLNIQYNAMLTYSMCLTQRLGFLQ